MRWTAHIAQRFRRSRPDAPASGKSHRIPYDVVEPKIAKLHCAGSESEGFYSRRRSELQIAVYTPFRRRAEFKSKSQDIRMKWALKLGTASLHLAKPTMGIRRKEMKLIDIPKPRLHFQRATKTWEGEQSQSDRSKFHQAIPCSLSHF